MIKKSRDVREANKVDSQRCGVSQGFATRLIPN
jgi:hypothetical protein